MQILKALVGTFFIYGIIHDIFGQAIANVVFVLAFLTLFLISNRTIKERQENFNDYGIYESNKEKRERIADQKLFGYKKNINKNEDNKFNDFQLDSEPKLPFGDSGYKYAKAEEELSEAKEIIKNYKNNINDEKIKCMCTCDSCFTDKCGECKCNLCENHCILESWE